MAEPTKKSSSKLVLIVLGVVVVAVIVGLGYLGTVDLPPPKGKVEKVISDDHFPK